jgi:hypothetical protein
LIPSLDYFFDAPKFRQQPIMPISEEEYHRIQKYAGEHQIASDTIPVFGREPETGQEVLALFVAAHERLGVKKIFRIQKAFPAVTVELDGLTRPVQLELELFGQSHLSHGHPIDRNVGLLCWINDDASRTDDGKVQSRVHSIYEMRDLLIHNQRIVW